MVLKFDNHFMTSVCRLHPYFAKGVEEHYESLINLVAESIMDSELDELDVKILQKSLELQQLVTTKVRRCDYWQSGS